MGGYQLLCLSVRIGQKRTFAAVRQARDFPKLLDCLFGTEQTVLDEGGTFHCASCDQPA